MRKFKGLRKLDEVIWKAEGEGWEVDTEAFASGSDWIYLRDMFGEVKSNDGMPTQVAYNTTNGHFFVYTPFQEKAVASHKSAELDNEGWYKALLDMFYEPLEKETVRP